MVTDQDSRGYVRYLHIRDNYSVSKISRKTGLSRKTVRDIIKDKKPSKTRDNSSKLDAYKDEIQAILKEKSGLSVVLILEKLREKGYDGGKTIVYDYIAKLRDRSKQAYFHLQTLPGEQAQVDWAYCGSICCGNHNRKLYVFCMTLSYSRYLYIEFTVSMDIDTFLACHVHAFNFFGGIPKTIVYDNLKSVVLQRIRNEITFNAHHFDFALFYGFSPLICNVRKPHEKGKVERIIKYVKGNFLARGPYKDFDHIKLESKNWLTNVANKRIQSVTRKVPEDIFLKEEKPILLPLPPSDYDYSIPRTLHVNKDSLVKFQTNIYSVPYKYASKVVRLRATTTQIKVYSDNSEIAVHPRCYDKYQIIKNPEHYKGLLEQKNKARVSVEIEEFEKLCIESKDYLQGLLKQQKNVHYHIRKILELCTLFGKTAVSGAMVKALSYKAFHWEYIKNILLETPSYNLEPVVSKKNLKKIMEIDIQVPDLSKYDQINNGEKDIE
jgi:transposase